LPSKLQRNRMKIAIIDDELHCVESLLFHLNRLFQDVEVVYKSTRPKEAVDALLRLKPDLLFLDIEMPGISGFELLKKMERRTFDVIFTTAYSQYAIQAFKAQAINYLLKPIDETELQEAVLQWMSRKRVPLSRNGPEQRQNKIAVPTADGLEFIEVDQVMYCQSQNNYSHIYLKEGREILISKTLKEVELAFEKFRFIRTHQSFLVNPDHMQKYVRHDGGYLVMKDGKEIPVSKGKRDLITGLFGAIRRLR